MGYCQKWKKTKLQIFAKIEKFNDYKLVSRAPSLYHSTYILIHFVEISF